VSIDEQETTEQEPAKQAASRLAAFGPADYAGRVPSPVDVIGADFGERDFTAAEILRYLDAVAVASDRVAAGRLSRRSHQGRELGYAVVGRPENIGTETLARIARDARLLRDGRAPQEEAERIAGSTPAILWIVGNTHGDEKSGADASLQVLRDLADRTDAAAAAILDAAVVVIVPTGNPDGRELNIRRNGRNFDLNRDWQTRTQPEIDALLELARELPPVLLVDAHEMTQRETFWIPPYGDPTYHEVHRQAVTAVRGRYAPAVAEAFERAGIRHLDEEPYDAFYAGKGSTVSTTAFLAAGVLLEKEKSDPPAVRVAEQYIALWALLAAAAAAKGAAQREVHAAHAEAVRQGEAGLLMPNRTGVAGNSVAVHVPDRTVRHYFLLDSPDRSHELHQLVRRLVRADVEVYRLREPLQVPDFRPYGRGPRPATLPAGTWWIPMAQSRKHFVQAVLNESTYPAVPIFYDVSAWSQPLLLNIDGGSSGVVVPGGPLRRAEAVAEPGPAPPLPPPERVPRAAVWVDGRFNYAVQSAGWFRHTWQEHWGLPPESFEVIDAAAIRAGALAGYDVLIIPEGASGSGAVLLDGTAELRRFVERGGTLIAWRQAARLVANLGIGSVTYSRPDCDIPGSLLRLRVDESSPLAAGVGPFVWAMNENDAVLCPGARAAAPVRYPELDSEDFFVSGYGQRLEAVAGTAAVTDEAVGAGRIVLFAFEPNFRAASEGTSRLVWNALFGRRPGPVSAVAAPGVEVPGAAHQPPRPASDETEPLVVAVDEHDAGTAERLVRAYADPAGLDISVERTGRQVRIRVANPGGWDLESHPFATRLAADLRHADIRLHLLRLL
jgi:hypothetical protein